MTRTPAHRTGILTQLRDELTARREAHDAVKSLKHDLASFTTEAELDDLDAMIEREDPANTVEIRRILSRQRAA